MAALSAIRCSLGVRRRVPLVSLLALAAAAAALLQGIAFVILPGPTASLDGNLLAARAPSSKQMARRSVALAARGGAEEEAAADDGDDDDEYEFDSSFEDYVSMSQLKVGQELSGVVTMVRDKIVLVDVGVEKEGLVPISKLVERGRVENCRDVVSEGDSVTVWVVEVDSADGLRNSKLTLSMAKNKVINLYDLGPRAELSLYEGLDSDEWLDGTVVSNADFGTFVSVTAPDGSGQAQGLVYRTEVKDGGVEVGAKVKVRVVSVDSASNKMGLSMKEPAPPRGAEADLDLFSGMDSDEWIDGTVVSNVDFGSFVAVTAPNGAGEAQGLVYRTEVKDEGVAVGEQVKVRVLSVDSANNKMSLSMKEPTPPRGAGADLNPFREMDSSQWISGVVKRLEDFGAFVEVAPPGGGQPVSGLVHISQIKEGRVEDPAEELEMNQEVKVRVLEVNDKGLSLSMKQEAEAAAPAPEPVSAA